MTQLSLPLNVAAERFLTGDAVCTLCTVRPDGSAHVAPVRFTWDGAAGLARVMTVDGRSKVRNLQIGPGNRASLCQLVGYRWLTLEGPAEVSADPDRVVAGIDAYLRRYHSPPPMMPGLVVIEVKVDRAMGDF
jgi:PPOX class probable F420-dependent enzyme